MAISRSLVRARGRLERRDGAINVLVAELDALEPRPSDAVDIEPRPSGKNSTTVKEVRERAVAELRAVAPAGHSFGRRGR